MESHVPRPPRTGGYDVSIPLSVEEPSVLLAGILTVVQRLGGINSRTTGH